MISTIVVCGSGTMGSGIAETCARGGFHTILYDLDPQKVEKALQQIHLNLDNQVAKGKLSGAEASACKDRLHGASDLYDCIGDLVIEAIIEKEDAKWALFNQLAEINHSDTIFATNTSSLSVSRIASNVMHPERICGLHFFNPAPLMKLVEVVQASDTRADIIPQMTALCEQLGKIPVVCKDAPGFIVNRVARHYYLEPLRLVEKGHARIEEIDQLMESAGFRMGPFKLMDLIGNDINYAVTESLYEACGQPERLKPSNIQHTNVKEGKLGRKTGEGFYTY
jgi:3-hydroxybutyryl-CoA dehydrogenase